MLVRQDVRTSILTQDLQALFELETCLAGGTELAENLPRRSQEPLPEVCERIAELAPAKVLFGPSSFLFQSVEQISQTLQGQTQAAQQAAASAAQAAQARRPPSRAPPRPSRRPRPSRPARRS